MTPRLAAALLLVASLPPATAEEGRTPSEVVRHILVDIKESVRKASADADVTYAMLGAYSDQMQTSLQKEVSALNQSLAKLTIEQVQYRTDVRSSQDEIRNLGSSVQGSEQIANSYVRGSSKVEKKFESLLSSVQALIGQMQNAVLTRDGSLVTPLAAEGESTAVLRKTQRLLQMHTKGLQKRFSDVVTAFSTDGPDEVRLTPKLQSRTIAALQAIRKSLSAQKVQALGQLESRVQKYNSDAAYTTASLDAQEGSQALAERKAADISFGIGFNRAVLQKDVAFMDMVTKIADTKKGLINEVRALRAKELSTMQELIDMLSGNYHVAPGSQRKVGLLSQRLQHSSPVVLSKPPSFLQTKSRFHGLPGMSALQRQVEASLHNKTATHLLLLKIKGAFDKQVDNSIDTDNVRDVMATLQDVLREAEGEQSKADAVKRNCDSQLYRAKEEEQGVKANIALMTATRSTTASTVQAAQKNLLSISNKMDGLQKSVADCTQISRQSLSTLEDQARDRSTFMVALEKSIKIAERGLYQEQQGPVVVLLQQLLQDITEQEQRERRYREETAAFKAGFMQYEEGYAQLLKDRQSHFEDVLAALQLHGDDINQDYAAQADQLASSEELMQENKEMCDNLLQAYQSKQHRREGLIQTLKAILPKVPEILDMEAPTTSDEE